MLRSSLIAAGAVLMCSAGYAQQTLSPRDLHPLTVPLQRAGTYNYETKRWLPAQQAAQLSASAVAVYDNTCTYSGGNYYAPQGGCAQYFDEGMIPGGIGGPNPTGATVDNQIDFFEFAYCTTTVTGAVDIAIGFYESLAPAGACFGGVSPNPPPLSTTATAYFDFGLAAGFPLPGSATTGAMSCWIVGMNLGNAPFCMQSDGEGIWDNNLNLDQFGWSIDLKNTNPAGLGQGVIHAGDPPSSGVGGCTYNIPCGTDYFSGAPCGHGFGTEDMWWANVDADSAATPGLQGPGCSGLWLPDGGCYWYGGYPSLYASFYMKMGSAGQCAGCTGSATNYCTAGTTTNGCNATVSMVGVPSASNAAPCFINVASVEGAQTGLIFYGLSPLAAPWGTGTSFLCVKAPSERAMTPTATGGAVGTCGGALSVDANAYWAANPAAPHVGMPIFVGEVFYFQGWFRDPPAPKTTNLSDGLSVTVCP